MHPSHKAFSSEQAAFEGLTEISIRLLLSASLSLQMLTLESPR